MRPAFRICTMLLCSASAATAQSRRTTTASDFPAALSADTRSLEFHVARRSTGSLQAQVRSSVEDLLRRQGGARLVKLRVFAVGAVDLKASRTAILRALAAAKRPLPVISLVGVTGFPDVGQRVEIESTASGGEAVNPAGVGFIAGLAAPAGDRTIAGLARVTQAAGIPSAGVLRITCFYEQRDKLAATRTALAATFPDAEASFVHSYAASPQPIVECEAVARLSAAPRNAVQIFNIAGVTPSPNYSHAALVATPTVIFAGGQEAANGSDSAMRGLFERISAAVAPFEASLSDVVMGHNYWLTAAARDTLRAVRTQYFGGTVPAATGLFFSSLVTGNAGAALELVFTVEPPARDTVTLRPGSEAMDGRYLKSHLTEVTRTIEKGGVVERKDHYALNKFVTQEGGRPVFQLFASALADAPDPSLRVMIVLDHRTMALIRREERTASGRALLFTVDGGHVVGSLKPARDSATTSIDFTLTEPAFLVSFLDAVANAADLRRGQLLRIPAFGVTPEQRQITWRSLRVVGRDTIRVGDHLAAAWVVEEAPGPTFTSRKTWLMREPPYFPREVTVLPDGSVQRIEQRLLNEHP